jgi:GR25 family glycosyltransferase involved in LPS biosynthesis
MTSFVNSIVDQVFVINMDKDKDRLDKIASALSKQNISFERVTGVSGKDVNHDDRLTNFCNSFCGDSVKGCALSHRNIWDIAQKRGYDAILVFEDDADIPEDLSIQLQRSWHKKPNDYDIISLGVDGFGREENNISSKLQDLTGLYPKQFNSDFISIHGLLHTHAMIVSKSGIQKLRSHTINGHIDLEITFWSFSDQAKLYAFEHINILQNNTDFDSNNSVKSSYPHFANYIFKQIHFSNNRTFDYVANISTFKLGSLKITPAILILFLITLFVPQKYKFRILAYLVAEFIVTPSFSEAMPYFIVWTIAFLIVYIFNRKI